MLRIFNLFITLLAGFSAHAATPECVLFASVTPANVEAWRALGYEVRVDPSLNAADFETQAKLLTDNTYLLHTPGNGARELRFSLTQGRYSERWEPIVIQAPPATGAIGKPYACASMQSQRGFFRQSRAGIADLLQAAGKQKVSRPLGEIFLDVENSFFVHKGVRTYPVDQSKAAYSKLLTQARIVRNSPETDFFQAWRTIRELVYSRSQTGVDYCRDSTTVSSAMIDRCTNCVGETYLLLALFHDAGFTPPPGWKLGAQSFTDHLRPVLYNSSEKRTYDLATGRTGKYKAAILDVETVYAALWRGHPALRGQAEWAWLKKQQPKYEFRASKCNLGDARPAMRPSEFNFFGCDTFAEGDVPPDRMSNEMKTDTTRDEDEMGKLYAGGPSELEGQASATGGSKGGMLPGWIGQLFGSKANAAGDSFLTNYVNDLKNAANYLNKDDRAAFLASIEKREFTEQALARFNLRALLKAAGMDEKLSPVPDMVLKPLGVCAETSVLNGPRSAVALSATSALALAEEYRLPCIVTDDSALLAKLTPLSSRDRWLWLFKFVREQNTKFALSLNDAPVPGTELSKAMSNLDKILRPVNAPDFAGVVLLNVQLPGLLQSLTSPSNASYDRDATGAALSKAVARETGAYTILPWLTPIVRTLDQAFDSPITTLKWLDALSETDKNETALTLQTLLLSQSRFEYLTLRLGMKHWFSQQPSPRFNSFFTGLTLKVLTHPDYFITVEAEKDEAVAGRPAYPISIRDPRVREEQHAREFRKLPELASGLPAIAGSACDPASTALYQMSANGFFVECNGTARNAAAPGVQIATQSGAVNGGVDGNASGVPGEFATARDGLMRTQSQGEDNSGEKILAAPLSEEQKQYPLRPESAQAQPGVLLAANVDEVVRDPRQEVYLKPSTWDWLLRGDRLNLAAYAEEPLLKILIHHTYRRKMQRTILELRNYVPVNVFTPADLDPTLPALNVQQFANSIVERVGGDLFAGFGSAKFMQAALKELERPKAGFVVITAQSGRLSDVVRAIPSYLPAAGTEKEVAPGVIAPTSVDGGGQMDLTLDHFSKSWYRSKGHAPAERPRWIQNLTVAEKDLLNLNEYRGSSRSGLDSVEYRGEQACYAKAERGGFISGRRRLILYTVGACIGQDLLQIVKPGPYKKEGDERAYWVEAR